MIKFRAVYKIFPIPVFYVDDLSDGFAGQFKAIIIPIIKIKNSYKDDVGLVEHELEHCRQYIRMPVIHAILYKIVPQYRYWAELQAYRRQLEFNNNKENSIEYFAKSLSMKYGLNISVEKARADLLK